ncbi:MAG: RNA polymerase sigma factor, partial [Holophagales bacterium]|nr:RNA polymerase sigma factor [Holophagales bacterium]
RYALSLAHSPEDAEDLVQSACVKLVARYGELGSRALLFTTIRNLFFDGWRRAKVLAFGPLEEEAADELVAPESSPGVGRDLRYLLGKLRPEEREAIYLHVVEGYTADEIGSLPGRPRNTVLSLIHRARKRLAAAAVEETEKLDAEGG